MKYSLKQIIDILEGIKMPESLEGDLYCDTYNSAISAAIKELLFIDRESCTKKKNKV